MRPPELTTRTVRVLRRELQARRFAVPKLQRNFVWDAGRAAKLLDSMYHNMPIGSLFLWEMDRKSANLIRQSTSVLPSFNSNNSHIWFVIDGQQRLSVIYQAFEGELRQNDSGGNIDFARLCFGVHPDPDQPNASRIVYRKAHANEFVPLKDILAPDWRRRMPSTAQWFLKRIRDCRERLLNYPLPVVTVRKAMLDEIGEVFIRVNAQGMRISSADRAIALMGALDVRAMAQEVRQRVRDEVFALGGIEPILMGFNLVAENPSLEGDPPKLEAMARRWSKRIEKDDAEKERFTKLWHDFQNAFLKAVDYIHQRFPVYNEDYLPSVNMLATLAVFFYHHPSQPSGRQAAEIQKWFWATGVAQRYSGRGYHRNIAADAQFFRALANNERRRFNFSDWVDPLDLQRTEYSSRSARTRAFFCLLALQQPRLLESGEHLSLNTAVVSHANRRHRHHIFPRAQLSRYFPPRDYNSLCNICFLVSEDNLAIGKKLPRSYLAEYAEVGRQQFQRILRSHLIPAGPEAGVWKPGIVQAFKHFRAARLKLICTAFERQAGMRLFRKP